MKGCRSCLYYRVVGLTHPLHCKGIDCKHCLDHWGERMQIFSLLWAVGIPWQFLSHSAAPLYLLSGYFIASSLAVLLYTQSFLGLSWVIGNTESPKPRENQKTKKPKLFRECLVWGSCLFFWFCLGSFVFLVLTLKNLKKNKVFLVFWINWWLKNCEKPKNSRFFWFFIAQPKRN